MLPLDKREALTDSGVSYQSADFYKDNTYIRIDADNFIAFKSHGKVVADADIGFKKHSNGFNVIANGSVIENNTSGIAGKLEVVADPDDAAKKCWLMSMNKADADSQSANAKRAEFGFTNANSTFTDEEVVIGYKFRLNDYSLSQDQFLIFQVWSAGLVEGTYSPPVGLYHYYGNLKVQKRWALAPENQIVTDLYQIPDLAYEAWNTVIIKLKPSRFENGGISEDGLLDVYLNNNRIVSYIGKIGYGAKMLLKSGFYQWSAPTNWDSNYLTKTMYTKGPYMSESKDCTVDEMKLFMADL